MQVVKGPVTRYLPTGATRIALSHRAPETKDMFEHVKSLLDEGPVVFIVGGFADGNLDTRYADQEVSISNYMLSAAQAITRITNACEQHLNII
jgi:rRNA pseudouridine-1189 N-methylase Emg1 (Nep1/Mra1 family)